ncbi:MAG TPA: hypothetical protein VFD03_11600, partial [Clostridia bacterium]|nr:hypothetical protein [Clostridia bacterium]
YDAINIKLKELNDSRIEMQLTFDGEQSISNRIKNFRNTFNTNEKMDEFDRDLFESLVEKVVVGKEGLDGNPQPYSICFILKTGLKFDEEILKSFKKSKSVELDSKTCFFKGDEQEKLCLYTENDTRGEGSSAI